MKNENIKSRVKAKPKQIKSFTVDGDVYSWLVERLNEMGTGEFTISSLINDYLCEFKYELNGILDYFEENKIPIDRAWVIKNYIEEKKAYPPESIDLTDPDLIEIHAADLQQEAELMIKRYENEKNIKISKLKTVLQYGVCGQCANWDSHEFCNVKNKHTIYVERCDDFEIKKGIKKKDLMEVQVTGKMKTTKWSIVVD